MDVAQTSRQIGNQPDFAVQSFFTRSGMGRSARTRGIGQLPISCPVHERRPPCARHSPGRGSAQVSPSADPSFVHQAAVPVMASCA